MDPVYSRDECVAAIRDYYDFLAKSFMDPLFIVEPPQNGWPDISTDATNHLGKTEQVMDLLRHLPYIAKRPKSNRPEGIPGARFIDWPYIVRRIAAGHSDAEGELLMSEGFEDQFNGKIPSHCIGLVHGGYLMGNVHPDVILLDTKCGLVYWMNCPTKVQETASPQSSYLVHSLEGEPSEENENIKAETDGHKDEYEEDESGKKGEEEEEEEDNDEDEDDDDNNEDEDEDEDEDEIQWGPCWPVRHFFEMLKNQFRQLNFIPKNSYDVVDVWTDMTGYDEPIPEGFVGLMQAIYRKNGWPDVENFRKDDCLAELKRELDDKYPEHHRYYFRSPA
ncbi:hypothetical protein FB567DRAFT_516871 [Paraphoma chrysanthemicola]|uniref:Uncharacterized protein n=1 Tax=Paraphoma chrysanthemicola TaxID=798071 RepID=A0A8K0RED1_9PLEO|nr:hypothetical protein FB567DRAFT_516871 [Paraphoma chrysanthemicola]